MCACRAFTHSLARSLTRRTDPHPDRVVKFNICSSRLPLKQMHTGLLAVGAR